MKRKQKRTRLYSYSPLPSKAIERIAEEWTESANAFGDVGSCVVGAGIEFDYNGTEYVLLPRSQWQGSCSWEHNIHLFVAKLRDAGCENVWYNPGVLD